MRRTVAGGGDVPPEVLLASVLDAGSARARWRATEKEMLASAAVSAEAAAWFAKPAARTARRTAWARCPGCGLAMRAGIRRRKDAVFCSARCRVRVARARAAAVKEGVQPA